MIRRRPAALDIYIAAIVIAGWAVLGWSAIGLPSTPHAREWGILTVLALVASRFPMRAPGRNAWFSISDTFYMASALLFGPGAGDAHARDRQHADDACVQDVFSTPPTVQQ